MSGASLHISFTFLASYCKMSLSSFDTKSGLVYLPNYSTVCDVDHNHLMLMLQLLYSYCCFHCLHHLKFFVVANEQSP